MNRLYNIRLRTALLIYISLDVLCVGAGMGVPIFCILFGAPVGWYIGVRVSTESADFRSALRKILAYAIITVSVTFIGMCLIWGRCVVMLFDPAADFVNFGIPMILYQPKASFIGWLVLMIFISPFLQFLMTLFGAQAAMLRRG
jgi:hypothetical protein